MRTRIDDGRQNEMIVMIDASQFTIAELAMIQNRIEEMSYNATLLQQCRIETEDDFDCFRTFILNTTQPLELWAKIQELLFHSAELSARIRDTTCLRPSSESKWYRVFEHSILRSEKGVPESSPRVLRVESCSR